MKSRFLAVVVLGIALPLPASAANNSWTDGNGKWEVPGNWSLGVAPSTNDSADIITNAGNNTVTIDATTAGSFPSTLTVSNVTVEGPGGVTNTLSVDSAGLTVVNQMSVGPDPGTVGAINVTNAQLSALGVTVDRGVVAQSGASSAVSARDLVIGANGVGRYTQSGGTNVMSLGGGDNGFYLGFLAGSQGTYHMTGGSLDAASTKVQGALIVGDAGMGTFDLAGADASVTAKGVAVGVITNGTGIFNHTGGSLAVSNLVLGYNAGATGSYNIDTTAGASVLTIHGLFQVGFGGSGIVTQYDGSVTVTNPTGYVYLANSIGSSGAYVMNNGVLTANGIAVGGDVSSAGGPAVFTQTGGIINSGLIVWPSGTVNLNGGVVNAGTDPVADNIRNDGVININGGQLNLAGRIFGTGVVNQVAGAMAFAAGAAIDTADITLNGGTATGAGDLLVGKSGGSTGIVNIAGGSLTVTNGMLSVGNNGTIMAGSGVGRMTVSNGTLMASSIVVGNSAGSRCDLILADGGVISDGGCPSGTNCQILINSLGFTQTNGTVNACNSPLSLGVTAPGDSTVSGDSANDSFQYLYAGFSNVGTFTLAGGVVNVCAQFVVGHLGLDVGSVIATGAVWVTGGQLTMNSDSSIVGNSGVGQMCISNGAVTAAQVTVGNSASPSSFGTLTLAGGTLTTTSLVLPNPHSRFIFTGGRLNALGITNSNGQLLTLGNGVNPITLNLLGGISFLSTGLKISTNATVSGFGTIAGTVVNYGLILPSNNVLTFTGGNVTNNGTMRGVGGTTIETFGTMVNNGVIDIINGGGTNFHGGFINNGTVLNASSVKISQVSKSGQDFIVQVPSITGHTYQLQYTTSLTPTNWTNTGLSQAGNGGVLNFADPGGVTNSPARFYRVDCTAP